MVYAPEEKRRMDHLFGAFPDYIHNNPYSDIVWSDKQGCLRIGSFPEAARMLFWNFFSDAEDAWPEPVDPETVLDRIRLYLDRLQESDCSCVRSAPSGANLYRKSPLNRKIREARRNDMLPGLICLCLLSPSF